jgi:hypothetical protein
MSRTTQVPTTTRSAITSINFGDGSDSAVLTALWSFAEDQGLLANCSTNAILSAFEVGFNVQFHPDERRFRQKLIFALLDDLGCVFYDDYPIEKVEHLVGLSIADVKHLSFPVQIAVLDSLYSSYRGNSHYDQMITIAGTHREKAMSRTEAICNEVTMVRDTVFNAEVCTVSLIGVSRLQAQILSNRGFKIRAWDKDLEYVGQALLPNVVVGYADSVEEQLSEADIVLISGMTIGNNTLLKILQEARRRGLKSVCWAVTASNLAPLFRYFGLTSAICEGFPPYFFPGETNLKIFRDEEFRHLIAIPRMGREPEGG